ncbi:hypothetical protein SNE40_013889 [Patella caerulea]|uniref:JmjC domain-containing protein n=1 Tax=Patella caerulea TaxID=87958 RepID=A0AAN8PBR4_PATCE
MAKFKIAQREQPPKKLQHLRQQKQALWVDLKSYLPLLDITYSSISSIAGLVTVILAIFISSKLMQSSRIPVKKLEKSEPSVNLSTKQFVYDHQAAQLERTNNMDKYDFNYDRFGIDRRSELTLQEFWDVYDAKWPVVLTTVMDDWPARKWSTELFNKTYGEQRIVMKAVQGTLKNARGLALPLHLFIQHLNDSSPTSWTYLEDELFLQQRPELYKQVPRNLYTEEDFFPLFPKEVQPWDCMLLWGTAYSRSSLHIDPYNWTGTNAVLKGHKKWKLFPPGQDDLLYVPQDGACGFPLDCFKYNSPVDAFEPDHEQYPKFKQAMYLELDQFPGEFLIIPTGWFHQAYNAEETMAVSGQFMNRNNYLIIMEEILKAGSIKRQRLPAYFHSLLPPDQVKYLMSLLPKSVLRKGKKLTEDIIQQVERKNQKQMKEDETRKEIEKKKKKKQN